MISGLKKRDDMILLYNLIEQRKTGTERKTRCQQLLMS